MTEPGAPDADAGGLVGFGLPGELPDLSSMLDGIQRMQAAQEELHEGSAGGGAVRITATGGLQVTAVRIDPSAVDAADVGMLEDLVLAALHDLTARIQAAQQQAMGGLGALTGLFGGAGEEE